MKGAVSQIGAGLLSIMLGCVSILAAAGADVIHDRLGSLGIGMVVDGDIETACPGDAGCCGADSATAAGDD